MYYNCFIHTCAGLATGVALFAEVIKLIEVVWAALNTQLGTLQLQQRRWTDPAGLGSWSRTQLTRLVTFLTAGAISVIAEEMHAIMCDKDINDFF